MTVILGITGGIGSGKSIVSHVLSTMDIPVYDCDSRAKALNETDEVIRKGLIKIVGNEVYSLNGKLNREKLAEYLFASKEHTTQIDSLIHPRVKADITQWLLNQNGHQLVGIESAILFESGINKLVNDIINVSAPESVRLQRIIKRDYTDIKKIKARMHAQMNDEERIKLCKFTITNDNEHALIPQILKITDFYLQEKNSFITFADNL